MAKGLPPIEATSARATSSCTLLATMVWGGSRKVESPAVSISGTGMTLGTVTRVDATHLRVVVTADSTATTGPRSLTVTNTDAGKVTATNAVTVT